MYKYIYIYIERERDRYIHDHLNNQVSFSLNHLKF